MSATTFISLAKTQDRESSFQKLARGVFLATLVSGTLDAIAGIVVYDFALGRMSIIQILQWIASGVFGARAFEMGLAGAIYGTIFHYLVAFGFSLGLFIFYERLKVLKDYPVFSGLAFGGYVWVGMNFLVLPLSNTVVGGFEPGVALIGFVWHMLLVGLPITLIAKKSFN